MSKEDAKKYHRPRGPIDVDWMKGTIEQHYPSVAAFSLKYFGHKDIFAGILKGRRGIQAAELVVMSDKLQIPVPLIMQKLGFIDTADPTCPVIGTVNGKGRISLFGSKDPKEVVNVPAEDDLLEPAALRVLDDDDVPPVFRDARLIFENPEVPRIDRDAPTRLCVVHFGHPRQRVLAFVTRHKMGSTNLQMRVFGTDERQEAEFVVSATPIRWLKIT